VKWELKLTKSMKLMLALNDVGGGAGAVTGEKFGICVGSGVCACWGGDVGFASWGGQSGLLKSGVCRSVVVNSWLPSFDGVSLPTTSR
jgi:hypothetical protein